MSRRGLAVDALCALLVIPVWTFYGALAAIVCAVVLGLLLRLVVHNGSAGLRRQP